MNVMLCYVVIRICLTIIVCSLLNLEYGEACSRITPTRKKISFPNIPNHTFIIVCLQSYTASGLVVIVICRFIWLTCY